MKTTRARSLAAVLATLTSAVALADSHASTKHVFGYLDTETGAFHPFLSMVPDATTLPTTGTVEVTFTVKLVSTFPKGAILSCGATVFADVVNATTFASSAFSEDATEGVALSGGTATCAVKIPYSWLLPAVSGATESFTVGYTLLVENLTSSGAPSTTGLTVRTSTGPVFAATKIPASGTISKYTVTATL